MSFRQAPKRVLQCAGSAVREAIVLRYAEILLRDTGDCLRAFSRPPGFGLTVVELR